QLTLKIDSKAKVYNCDEIAIKTTGLMGEKSIAVLPKLPPQNKEPEQIIDQIAYATCVDALENTFSQVTKVAQTLDSITGKLDSWFEQNQNHLGSAIRSFDGAMSQIDAVLSLVDTEKLIPSLRESLSLLNTNMDM